MATEIEDLLIRIDATTEGLRREMKKGERQVASSTKKMQGSLGGLDKAFRGVGKALGVVGISAISLTALVAGVKRVISSTAQLGDVADKLGVTAEQLQELRFAAEQFGVSANTLDMGLQRFIRRTGEAVKGAGELKQTYIDLGIALKNTDGTTRDSVDVLKDYANAIRDADSDAEALRLAFKGFDSEGAALVTLFRKGAIGIEEMADRLRELDGVISNEAVKQAQELQDAWTEFATILDSKVKSAILGIVDAFNLLGRGPEEELARITAEIETLEAALAKPLSIRSLLGVDPSRLGELEAERSALIALIDARKQAGVSFEGQGLKLPSVDPRPPPLTDDEKKAADEAFQRSATMRAATPIARPPQLEAENIEALIVMIKAETESLEDLRRAYAESTEAGDAMLAKEKALAEARQRAVGGSEEEIQVLAKSIEARNAASSAIDKQKDASEELIRTQEKLKEEMEDLNEEMLGAGVDAITALASGYDDARVIAVKAIAEIITALIKMIALQEQAASGVSGGGSILSGVGSILGKVIGGFSSSGGGATSGYGDTYDVSKFAGGGRPPVGVPSLVGERGPELFVPDGAGTIIPNHQLGGSGGSSFFIDARGADRQGLARLEGMIRELDGTVDSRAITAVASERRRNPRMFQ